MIHLPEPLGIALMRQQIDNAFAARGLHGKRGFDGDLGNSVVIDAIERQIHQAGKILRQNVKRPRRILVPAQVQLHLLKQADDIQPYPLFRSAMPTAPTAGEVGFDYVVLKGDSLLCGGKSGDCQ